MLGGLGARQVRGAGISGDTGAACRRGSPEATVAWPGLNGGMTNSEKVVVIVGSTLIVLLLLLAVVFLALSGGGGGDVGGF
jgi:hypothetical protein